MKIVLMILLSGVVLAGCSGAQTSLNSREQVEIQAADCPPDFGYDPASGRCISQ